MAVNAVLKIAIERFVESTMSKFAVASLRRSQGLIVGHVHYEDTPLRHSKIPPMTYNWKSRLDYIRYVSMALSSAQLASCSAFVTQRRFFNRCPLIRVYVYTLLDSISFTY